MIPKIIHYCWFGQGKKPEDSERYIAGWKLLHPDYKIIEWNEDNFDVLSNVYTAEAYRAKKWAFVTDYVRLYALYKYGGIYMDTDVEVLKPLNEFLSCKAFSGFEVRDSVSTGIMGAEKNMPVIKELLDYYEGKHFLRENGTLDLTTNVRTITDYFVQKGLRRNGRKQTVNGFTFFPQIVFCPNTVGMIFHKEPSKSYTIHHFFGSWCSDDMTHNMKIGIGHFVGGKLRNLLGSKRYAWLRGME